MLWHVRWNLHIISMSCTSYKHCQSGLFLIFRRLAVRDVTLEHKCDVSTQVRLEEAVKRFFPMLHSLVLKRFTQAKRESGLYKQGQASQHLPDAHKGSSLIDAFPMRTYASPHLRISGLLSPGSLQYSHLRISLFVNLRPTGRELRRSHLRSHL